MDAFTERDVVELHTIPNPAEGRASSGRGQGRFVGRPSDAASERGTKEMFEVPYVRSDMDEADRKQDKDDLFGEPQTAPNWLGFTHWYTPLLNTFGVFGQAARNYQIIVYVALICGMAAAVLAILDVAWPGGRDSDSGLSETVVTAIGLFVAIVVPKTYDIAIDTNRVIVEKIGSLYGQFEAIVALNLTSDKFVEKVVKEGQLKGRQKALSSYVDGVSESIQNLRSVLDPKIPTHDTFNTFDPIARYVSNDQFTDSIVIFCGDLGELIALRSLPIPIKYHQAVMFIVTCYYGILWPIAVWSRIGWWAVLMVAVTSYYSIYFLWNAGEITRTIDSRTEAYILDKHRRIVHAINITMDRLVRSKVFDTKQLSVSHLTRPVVPE